METPTQSPSRRLASAALFLALAVSASYAAAMAVVGFLPPTLVPEGLVAEPAVIDFGPLEQDDAKFTSRRTNWTSGLGFSCWSKQMERKSKRSTFQLLYRSSDC